MAAACRACRGHKLLPRQWPGSSLEKTHEVGGVCWAVLIYQGRSRKQERHELYHFCELTDHSSWFNRTDRMNLDVELVLLTYLKHTSSEDHEYKLVLDILERDFQTHADYGDLETDGNIPVLRTSEDSGFVDEELCRRIGAQLAELGDKLEREGRIKKEVVECVVQDLLTNSLTESRFEELIKSVMQNLPAGIETEKATVAVAMALTKEVGCSVPSLLQNFFYYTAGFIQRNYLAYLQQIDRQR
ncbi:BH3-interacting domain death agonist [Pelobates cultripes]|uniref:BH3-interacting domain death agonist n=1 Tax=Pelobates cultripes TaxID=61616 RepID=A0AAD1VWU9_PELCU|nr:BH3-interacting domain death agonist [Pelobates cultripes]